MVNFWTFEYFHENKPLKRVNFWTPKTGAFFQYFCAFWRKFLRCFPLAFATDVVFLHACWLKLVHGLCWSSVSNNSTALAQGRPTSAAWFDALVFDPRFGGQNCLFVAQTLQAELVNLMAMRQNLRFQIGVCWLQCLIELAGAGVGDLQI